MAREGQNSGYFVLDHVIGILHVTIWIGRQSEGGGEKWDNNLIHTNLNGGNNWTE